MSITMHLSLCDHDIWSAKIISYSVFTGKDDNLPASSGEKAEWSNLTFLHSPKECLQVWALSLRLLALNSTFSIFSFCLSYIHLCTLYIFKNIIYIQWLNISYITHFCNQITNHVNTPKYLLHLEKKVIEIKKHISIQNMLIFLLPTICKHFGKTQKYWRNILWGSRQRTSFVWEAAIEDSIIRILGSWAKVLTGRGKTPNQPLPSCC